MGINCQASPREVRSHDARTHARGLNKEPDIGAMKQMRSYYVGAATLLAAVGVLTACGESDPAGSPDAGTPLSCPAGKTD